jgi:DNA-binding SARP family transcriptional activator
MSEADLTQTLVLQFLQHEGYIETARAFAKDMQTQKAALDVDPKAEVPAINLKDDADSHNRQRKAPLYRKLLRRR